MSINGGGTWTNIGGQTAATLVLPTVTSPMNGSQYRVEVKEGGLCPVYSTAATLTVSNPSTPLSIAVDAMDPTTCTSSSKAITATPAGGTTPYASYVWSATLPMSGSGGVGAFTPSSSQTAAVSYSVPTPASGGRNVRVTVTDANGCTATSSNITNISIYNSPVITALPATQTICSGTAIGTITATNTNTGIGGSGLAWSVLSSNANITIAALTLTAATTNGSGQTSVTLPSTTVFTNTQTTVQSTNLTFTATTPEGCVATAVAAVTVNELIVSNAGSDITQAGLTFNLNGNAPSVGAGLWSVVSPNSFAAANISSLSNRNATVSNLPANVAVTLRWTVTQGSCSVSDDVVLTRSELILDLKALLAGPLNTTTNTMNDDLRTLSLIPTSSSTAYAGTSETITGSTVLTNADPQTAVVDWVLVELRSSPTMVVASKAALILRNGDIRAADGASNVSFNLPAGDYFVDIRHRNHLGVMTAAAVNFSLPSGMSKMIDFSNAATATYTTTAPAQKTIGSIRAMYAGDANGNGDVRYNGSNNDRAAIQTQLGAASSTTTTVKNGYYREDINMNGQVKLNGANNDRIIILNMIGGASTTTAFISQQF